MTVPLYWMDTGLPLGAQFVAGLQGEATLTRIADQLEEARPWADVRPLL